MSSQKRSQTHDQQRATLQALINRRGDSEPSMVSDQEILREAELHCAKRNQRIRTVLSWLFAPAGVASNAFASVAVTAMVFLVLAQVVVPSDLELTPGESVVRNAEFLRVSNPAAVTAKTPEVLKRPEVELYSPDQVLLELSLPNVADLIRSMEFVAEAERAEATIELISALAEIESSIGIGELGAARERYSVLRERCYACDLPATLEALALLKLDASERG